MCPAPLTHIIQGKDLPPSPPSIGRHRSEGCIIIPIIRLTLSSVRPLLSSTSHSSPASSFSPFFSKDILFSLTEICSAGAGRRGHLRGLYTPREQRSATTPAPDPPAGRDRHSPRLVDSEQPCAVYMWPLCGLQMRWWWFVVFCLWGNKAGQTYMVDNEVVCLSVLGCPGIYKIPSYGAGEEG